jgi:hypothetical protein
MLRAIFSSYTLESDETMACVSGAITDAVVHRRGFKRVVGSVIRACVVGYFLANFVSPSVEQRFNLNKNEAIAASFICGYAGIRLLTMAEKILEIKIRQQIKERESQLSRDTDSSKLSEDV